MSLYFPGPENDLKSEITIFSWLLSNLTSTSISMECECVDSVSQIKNYLLCT